MIASADLLDRRILIRYIKKMHEINTVGYVTFLKIKHGNFIQ